MTEKIYNRETRTLLLPTLFVLGYLLLVAPSGTDAATLYFYPDSYTLPVDESVVVEVRLDTEGERVNAVEIEGEITQTAAEGVSVEMSGSFLPILLEAPLLENGHFRFVGSVPGGFEGSGVVGRLTVRGVTPGEAMLRFAESSRIFTHSDRGEELGRSVRDASIEVVSRGPDYVAISSETHREGVWSNRNSLYVSWDAVEGEPYSYHLSQLPTEGPDTAPDEPVGEIKYQGLSDGVYYFSICKLHREADINVCGVVSRYRAMIDATEPVWLSAEVSEGTAETEAQKFLSFVAEDSVSGVNRYEISIDGGPFVTTNSPLVLTEAKEVVVVKAIDQAGNEAARIFDLAPKRSLARTAAYIAFGVALIAALLYAFFR